jgi:hypothetical protein
MAKIPAEIMNENNSRKERTLQEVVEYQDYMESKLRDFWIQVAAPLIGIQHMHDAEQLGQGAFCVTGSSVLRLTSNSMVSNFSATPLQKPVRLLLNFGACLMVGSHIKTQSSP